MKPTVLLTVIFISICVGAQCQCNPELKQHWKAFKSALHEKNVRIRDFTSAIKKGGLADSTLLEEIKVTADYLDLRLGQWNRDTHEIRILVDLNLQLDERFSNVIKKIADADKLPEIDDFLSLQAALGSAMNNVYVSAQHFNETAESFGCKDLRIELYKGAQPPRIKF